MTLRESIVVVGAGVSGLSVALALLESKSFYPKQLTIIASANLLAASDDTGKIIRADYPSRERSDQAEESCQAWRDDPFFKRFYNQVGRVAGYDEDSLHMLQTINTVREQRGLAKLEHQDRGVLAIKYASECPDTRLVTTFNDDDGVVRWQECMQAVLQRIRDLCQERSSLSFEVTQGEVCSLVSTDSTIAQIILSDGRHINTDCAEIVLATGAWTDSILHASGIASSPSHTITATGIFVFDLQLTEEQNRLYRDGPPYTHEGIAEFVPPQQNALGKITFICPFTNKKGTPLSQPGDLSQSHYATLCLLKTRDWARRYLSRLKGATIISIRSMWDGVTYDQNPVTGRHPKYENLLINAGLSYNRAKDLPKDGIRFWQNIHGGLGTLTIPSGSSRVSNHPGLVASRDFVDLEREARGDEAVLKWRRQHPEITPCEI